MTGGKFNQDYEIGEIKTTKTIKNANFSQGRQG